VDYRERHNAHHVSRRAVTSQTLPPNVSNWDTTGHCARRHRGFVTANTDYQNFIIASPSARHQMPTGSTGGRSPPSINVTNKIVTVPAHQVISLSPPVSTGRLSASWSQLIPGPAVFVNCHNKLTILATLYVTTTITASVTTLSRSRGRVIFCRHGRQSGSSPTKSSMPGSLESPMPFNIVVAGGIVNIVTRSRQVSHAHNAGRTASAHRLHRFRHCCYWGILRHWLSWTVTSQVTACYDIDCLPLSVASYHRLVTGLLCPVGLYINGYLIPSLPTLSHALIFAWPRVSHRAITAGACGAHHATVSRHNWTATAIDTAV